MAQKTGTTTACPRCEGRGTCQVHMRGMAPVPVRCGLCEGTGRLSLHRAAGRRARPTPLFAPDGAAPATDSVKAHWEAS